jgi:hypothetical protein
MLLLVFLSEFKKIVMKKFLLITLLISQSISFGQKANDTKVKINILLDNWHADAANVKFESYFNALHEESIYIGTDATENWTKKEYMAYAKPHFDKGKAWSFSALERNIYFSADKKVAWFDELLNTQMKICRGSGVLILTKNGWKIKHYVLSMTIPNDNTREVVKIKTEIEDKEILQLQEKK